MDYDYDDYLNYIPTKSFDSVLKVWNELREVNPDASIRLAHAKVVKQKLMRKK